MSSRRRTYTSRRPSSPIYSAACNLAQQAAAGIRAYNFTGLLDHDAKVSGAAFQRDRTSGTYTINDNPTATCGDDGLPLVKPAA